MIDGSNVLNSNGTFIDSKYYCEKFSKVGSVKGIIDEPKFSSILSGRETYGVVYKIDLLKHLLNDNASYRLVFESTPPISIGEKVSELDCILSNNRGLAYAKFVRNTNRIFFTLLMCKGYCAIKEIHYDCDHKIGLTSFLDSIEKFLCPNSEFNSQKPPQVYLLDKDIYGELSTSSFDIKDIEVSLEENYNDDIIEVDSRISDFVKNSETGCGLCLLHGNPSGGKTSYIRHIIKTHKNKKFIFVSPSLIKGMSGPTFNSFLRDNKGSILILEDAEEVLHKRNEMSDDVGISNLLQFSDGILSDAYQIKMIATFNTDLDRIDDALTRKGRLHTKYEFKKLSLEKSKNKAEKLGLDPDKIKEPMMLGDIYNLESDNGFKKVEKPKIGFN